MRLQKTKTAFQQLHVRKEFLNYCDISPEQSATLLVAGHGLHQSGRSTVSQTQVSSSQDWHGLKSLDSELELVFICTGVKMASR